MLQRREIICPHCKEKVELDVGITQIRSLEVGFTIKVLKDEKERQDEGSSGEKKD